MKFIKHKNNRDVCAQIIDRQFNFVTKTHRFKICWINLLGTYDDPNPFPIGSSSRLAIETVEIPEEVFKNEWSIATNPKDFRK